MVAVVLWAAAPCSAQLVASIEPGGSARYQVLARSDGDIRQVLASVEADACSLSPSGRFAALARADGVSVVDVDSGALTRLPYDGAGPASFLGWDAAGARLWLTRGQTLWLVDAVEARVRRMSGPGEAHAVTLGAGGEVAYYADQPLGGSGSGRQCALWLADPARPEPAKVSGRFVVEAICAPEAAGRLVFRASDPAAGALAFVVLDRERWQVLLADGSQAASSARLSPDGKLLAFATADGLFVSDLAGPPQAASGDQGPRAIGEFVWAGPSRLLWTESVGSAARSLAVADVGLAGAPAARLALKRPAGEQAWRLYPSPAGRSCLVSLPAEPAGAETYLVGLDAAQEPIRLPLTTWPRDVAWAPDGSLVAFACGGEPGEQRMYVYDTEAGGPGAFAGLDRALAPVWSPDSTRVAFLARGAGDRAPTAYLYDHRRGEPTRLGGDLPVAGVEWEPDGRAARLRVHVRDTRGQGLYALYSAAPGRAPALLSGPHRVSQWARTSSGDLAMVAVPRPAFAALRVHDLVSGEVWAPSGELDVRSARWSPDGARLYFTADVFDGRSAVYVAGAREAVARLVTERFLVSAASPPEWSPDGRRLALCSAGMSPALWVYDAETGALEPRAEGVAVDSVRWSPDGRWLAFGAVPRRGVQRGLCMVDATVGTVLAAGPDAAAYAWSPDSAYVALLARLGGGPLRLVLQRAGSTVPVPLVEGDVTEASWSPDGTGLLVRIHESSGRTALRTVSVDGDPGIDLAADCPAAEWAPGGGRLAFVEAAVDGTTHIVAADRDGSGAVRAPIDARSAELHWSPDGARVACLTAGDTGTTRLRVLDAQTGSLTGLGEGLDILGIAWAPDGSRVALRAREGTAPPGAYVAWLDGRPTARGAVEADVSDLTWLPDGSGLLVTTADDPPSTLLLRPGAEDSPRAVCRGVPLVAGAPVLLDGRLRVTRPAGL